MEKTRIQFSGNVQETLLIPLWMRAVESRRKDALFHDTVSCSLVERIDYDFRKFSRDRPEIQPGQDEHDWCGCKD